MTAPRRVTEEDLHVTEALIADSYARLKRSIAEAPRQAVSPAADMIKEHPFAATATAAGTGLLVSQLVKMFTQESPRGAGHKAEHKGGGTRSDLTSKVLSLATPVIVSVIQQRLSRARSRERR
jgi:hypothetical protein